MAGLIPIGSIVDPAKDIFASTGAHLDTRIIPRFGPQSGKRINPREARSILQNVLVGPNQTPLVQQVGQEWKWNFPVSSEYGQRTAPTAGASTFHQGIDIPIPAGTQLTYKGYGTFKPENGFGVLRTSDAQGNPYDIEFLHTVPGKAASVGSAAVPEAPQLPGENKQKPGITEEEFLRNYMNDYMQEQFKYGMMAQMLQPQKQDTIAEFQKMMQMFGQGSLPNPLG